MSGSWKFPKVDFNRFSVESEEGTPQPQPAQKMKKNKVYKFGDSPSGLDSNSTPIALISSNSGREENQPERKILAVTQLQTVNQDKEEGKLGVQTCDTLQRDSFFQTKSKKLEECTEQEAKQLNQQLLKCLLTLSEPQFLKYLQEAEIPSSQIKIRQKWLRFFNFHHYLRQWLSVSQDEEKSPSEEGIQLMKKWVTTSIKEERNAGNEVSFNQISVVLDHFLSDNIDQLIAQLIAQNNYPKALMVSNLSDRAFLDGAGREKLALKKEYNLISLCNLSLLSKSSWLFELSLTVSFSPERWLEQGRQIFNRYEHLEGQILPCELLLLGLSCRQNSEKGSPVSERIMGLVNKLEKEGSLLQIILVWFTLTSRKEAYSKSFQHVLQLLLIRISDPSLFQLILNFSGESDLIPSFLNLFLEKNPFMAQPQKQVLLRDSFKTVKRNSLKAGEMGTFREGLIEQREKGLSWSIFYSWAMAQDLKELQEAGKFRPFLEQFVNHFSFFHKSHFQELASLLCRTVVSFKMLCNYKQSVRIKNYQLLGQLERLVTSEQGNLSQLSRLIKGSRVLLEIKMGAFILNDPTKLGQLVELSSYLNLQVDRLNEGRQEAAKILRYLEEAVRRALESRDGHIFLSKVCKGQTIPRKSLKRENIGQSIAARLLAVVGNCKDDIWQKMVILSNFG